MKLERKSPPLTWRQARPWVTAFAIAMFIACSMVSIATPTKGHAFRQASPLVGLYQARATGHGWSIKTLIGNEVANCESSAYFIPIEKTSTCPPGDQFNGRMAIAERVEVPSFFGPTYLVKSIKFEAQVVYQLSDDQIRWHWLVSSYCFTVFPAMMIANLVWLFNFCLRKLSKTALRRDRPD